MRLLVNETRIHDVSVYIGDGRDKLAIHLCCCGIASTQRHGIHRLSIHELLMMGTIRICNELVMSQMLCPGKNDSTELMVTHLDIGKNLPCRTEASKHWQVVSVLHHIAICNLQPFHIIQSHGSNLKVTKLNIINPHICIIVAMNTMMRRQTNSTRTLELKVAGCFKVTRDKPGRSSVGYEWS